MMREFGGPLGETLKKQSRLETEIERVKLENDCKGSTVHAEEGKKAAGITSNRKRDAKAEEKGAEKEAEQKSSSSSSPLKELNH
jgi:hypothetical protein